MIKEAAVTVKVKVYINTDENSGFLPDMPAGGFVYGSEAKIRRECAKSAEKWVAKMIRNARNNERCVIVCNGGEVLFVDYNDGWGMQVARSTRGYSGGTYAQWKSFDEARQYARDRAADSYGGIAWESLV